MVKLIGFGNVKGTGEGDSRQKVQCGQVHRDREMKVL